MPAMPPMPCSYPGCPATVRTRYCDKHRPPPSNQPPRMSEEYARAKRFRSSAEWQSLRRNQLSLSPLCYDPLGQHGLPEPATEVHHIEPVAGRYELRNNSANLVSLCEICHLIIEAKNRDGQDTKRLFGAKRK